jgi:hypothetical protein
VLKVFLHKLIGFVVIVPTPDSGIHFSAKQFEVEHGRLLVAGYHTQGVNFRTCFGDRKSAIEFRVTGKAGAVQHATPQSVAVNPW